MIVKREKADIRERDGILMIPIMGFRVMEQKIILKIGLKLRILKI